MNTAAFLSILQQSVPYYVVFNLFVLFVFAYNRFAYYLVRDWPSVTGTVTSAGIDPDPQMRNSGASNLSPIITYTYEVNGEKYTNQRIAPGGYISYPGYARGILKRYPAGSQVTVYYDPDLPSVAFLSKRPVTMGYLTFFILGNLLIPFIVMFGNFVWQWRKTFFQ